MEPIATTATFVLNANELIAAFTSFLQFDVAAGGASGETIRTYWCEAKQFLLTLEGVRSMEAHRANVGDIRRDPTGVGIMVMSKRQQRVVPLIPDLVDLLDRYLLARRSAKFSTAAATPLFINVHHPRHQIDPDREDRRLSRRGIRFIVDSYLEALNLKHGDGRTLSAHSLRHTAGTLAIQNGASLRQVQDLLGHANPKTTAIYTHVGDRWVNNPALKLGIRLNPDPKV
jgi:integrase/recombinase XerD